MIQKIISPCSVISELNVPILSDAMVHIWHLTLPVSKEMIERFQHSLSEDEWLRAKSFHFKTHRDQFISSRGGLRTILSHYLNISAKNIKFCYTTHQKPYVDYTDLTFNISHSGEFIVYALTKNAYIGVDIEELKPEVDCLSLAKSVFHEEEYIKFLKIPKEDKLLAFYRAWTRKEAYLKAIGVGLHYPLNELQVSFLSTEPPKLLSAHLSPLEYDLWQLDEIFLDENYVATIATLFDSLNSKVNRCIKK